MGQKTNPNILRLGITKKWKTEFFEKNKKELPLYIFKDLEIQSYIERFFDMQGIIVHDYRQYYSNQTLNLYVSYFVSAKNQFNTTLEKEKQIKLLNPKGSNKFVSYKGLSNENSILKLKVQPQMGNIKPKKLYDLKQYLKSNYEVSQLPNFNSNYLQNSLNGMLKVISEFTGNKFDIVVNFSCINKDFTHLGALKNKKVKLLQRFKTAPFFKDGLELLFHVVFNNNSSRLLGKFIAFQLKTIKRPNFFLGFLKRTFVVLISSKLSKIKGVKIMLKGRLRKNPRATHKVLTVGDVAVQSLGNNLDYFQTTTHNSNGSYGIKVWIVEK